MNNPDAKTYRRKRSPVKTGWICLLLGFLTFWIFGLGFAFFIAAFAFAIVAASTDHVRAGVLLVIVSVASTILCGIVFVFLVGEVYEMMESGEKKKPFSDMISPTPIPND